jgi:hypothetical protein
MKKEEKWKEETEEDEGFWKEKTENNERKLNKNEV